MTASLILCTLEYELDDWEKKNCISQGTVFGSMAIELSVNPIPIEAVKVW